MPRAARSYNDPCGIARALDQVGERWALLVVRELLLGPKRFTQIRHGLHDASANVVAQRLRELEQAGLVRHTRLGPPASTLVYALTQLGHELEPLLLELGRWGSRVPITSDTELGVDALIIALKTRFPADSKARLRFELRLGDDRFGVQALDGRLQVERGGTEAPSAIVETDAITLRSLVFGGLPLSEASASGALSIEGDERALARFVDLFASGHASLSWRYASSSRYGE